MSIDALSDSTVNIGSSGLIESPILINISITSTLSKSPISGIKIFSVAIDISYTFMGFGLLPLSFRSLMAFNKTDESIFFASTSEVNAAITI